MSDVTYSTETLNNVDYLVARIGIDTETVEFQTLILTYTALDGLIAVSKRQLNDNVALYYDITAKKSLAQEISERRVSRNDFLNILSKLIITFNQLGEYHLVGSGIVLNKEYIYINDADFSPSFIYLPIEKSGNGIENIKHFISDLILSSNLESSSDNFIQVIREALNLDSFSLEILECTINDLNNRKQGDTSNPNPNEKSKNESADSQKYEAAKNQTAFDRQPGFKPTPDPKPLNVLKHFEQNDNEEAIASPEKSSFPLRRRTIVFVGIQVIVAVILIAYIASEAFIVNGQLQVLRIAVLLFIVLAVELIVFYVIYANTTFLKKPQPFQPISPKRRVELVPLPKHRDEVSPPIQRQWTELPQEKLNTQLISDEDIINAALGKDKSRVELNKDLIRAEIDGEKTVLMEVPGQGYLRGIDNTCNYLLNKPIAVIGRSQQKSDYVLSSERVGRSHAIIVYDSKRSEYSILDKDSLNGTFINDERISPYELYPLKNGDLIRFADSEFMIAVPQKETERGLRTYDGRAPRSQV